MSTIIRTSCKNMETQCGDGEFSPEDIAVLEFTYPSGDKIWQYRFTCDTCNTPSVATCESNIARLLIDNSCEVEKVSMSDQKLPIGPDQPIGADEVNKSVIELMKNNTDIRTPHDLNNW